VSISVKRMPSKNRYGKLLKMTLKSKSVNMPPHFNET
jgi:hypothetical protein